MPLHASKAGSGLDPREWNTLIGIITAIVGNVLISFALNIQRYAHIRLSQDREQRRRKRQNRKRRRKGIPGMPDYGSQLEVAEERAQMNRKAPHMDEEDSQHQEAYHAEDINGVDGHIDVDERTPLKGSSTVRSTSSGTVKPEEDGDDDVQKQNYLKSPYWWLGIILMTTGEAGNFIAYGFAPASIVSPLGVVALVSNCIIAPLLLKERFRQRDFWGVLIAIGGAVTVVLSAKLKDPKLGPDDIWVAISRWEFELYLGLTAAAIVVLMWVSSKYGQKSVFIDLGLVGLFGGYTALSTKGVASLLTDTIWRAVTFPIFYLLVAVLVITAIFQIRYVNRALQRFDSTRVVPTQFVCFTISVILGSAILYREFESATKENVGKFVGGCVMTFLGVWLITSGKRDNDTEEEYDPETGEIEGIRLIDEESEEEDIPATPKASAMPQATGEMAVNTSATRPQTPPRTLSATSEASMAPSTGSAVSPFSDNPWAGSDSGATLKPSTSASASEPVLPLEAQLRPPSTPTARRTASNSATPATLTPPAVPRGSLSRRSISRLLPGPISAPLSSSLSAVVADQLRRGVDVTHTPRGSKRAGLHKTRSNILDAEDANGNSVLADQDLPTAEEARALLQEQKGRTRSLSGTVGDALQKRSRPQVQRGESQSLVDGSEDLRGMEDGRGPS